MVETLKHKVVVYSKDSGHHSRGTALCAYLITLTENISNVFNDRLVRFQHISDGGFQLCSVDSRRFVRCI